MDSGFFVSGVAGDMTAQKLNTIAHNLANVNTTGYMLDRTAFSTMLANVEGAGKDSSKLPQAYMTMDHQFVSGDKGIIRQTGNDLDFA
ncbi:MAG: flagellar basal body protein, partial [Mariprofundaceae bacterium]|nr:flagellar basal body protein [Mariprofundaceae bacterium]